MQILNLPDDLTCAANAVKASILRHATRISLCCEQLIVVNLLTEDTVLALAERFNRFNGDIAQLSYDDTDSDFELTLTFL